jgi:hypothetical protein
MRTCCWYNASACCINQYTKQLDTFYSTFIEYTLKLYTGTISDSCYLNIADMLCYLCAPNSNVFVSWTPTVPILRICPGACQELYDSCKNDISVLFNSTTITFESSERFCVAYLTETLGVTKAVITSNDCFEGIPMQVVKQFQGVCIPPNSVGFVQPNFRLILLVLFVLLVICLFNSFPLIV